MSLELIAEAMRRGARQAKACKVLGLDPRTVQRWAKGPADDQRRGPRRGPASRLPAAERQRVLEVVNSPRFRDLPPTQIVPRLADEGVYLASESTIYRILRANAQLIERTVSPRGRRRPESRCATGPNQVWSWDITYLKAPIRGSFFYLYMMLDVWSRKIVACAVHEHESAELAADLLRRACMSEGITAGQVLVLHSDNGSPMKGATMLATMEKLGVVASFSRPRVHDDNPYSESCFRTMKHRPEYPDGPFASLEAARAWSQGFVDWYNHEHRHSAIRFVTPAQRHHREDHALLAHRREVYERARARRPERWSGACRNWTPVAVVELNPTHEEPSKEAAA